MPQVLLGTPFSLIEWSPSPPSLERPRQLLLPNNPFPPQINLVAVSRANYQGEINNYAVGRGNRSRRSGRRDINGRKGRARDVGSMAPDPSNEPSVIPDPGTNNKERLKKKGHECSKKAMPHLQML